MIINSGNDTHLLNRNGCYEKEIIPVLLKLKYSPYPLKKERKKKRKVYY